MSSQKDKTPRVNKLHEYLKNELYKELKIKYPHFTITQESSFEEGTFVLIKNIENIQKIIGIVPVNSDSIYDVNETFIVKDFTDKTSHFVHETLLIDKKPIKPVIVCDEQGGVLCFDSNGDRNKSGFISCVIKKENRTKSFILDNYDIDYESFYYVAKSDGINDIYRDLTDENKVIDFIVSL